MVIEKQLEMDLLEALSYDDSTVEDVSHLYTWRDNAINDSLRGFDNNEHGDALLQAIRTHLPDASTLLLWPDRAQISRFLTQGCGDVRSLITASHRYRHSDGDGYEIQVGWFAIDWEGESVELVLTPSTYGSSEAILICRNERVLFTLADAIIAFTERPTGRTLRYADGWENAPDVDRELGKVTWDDLVLPSTVMTTLRSAVEGFASNRAAYRKLGFAWRRGILLIGPPGTGKTMVCKAAAASLPDYPFLYVRDLREHGGADAIREIFKRARQLAPCILAFEDVDGLVNDFNRTAFLNEMDGFTNNEGVLVIASTNYPERVDEALLRRPSRFDQVIHIALPEEQERFEFCRRILTRDTLAGNISHAVDIGALCRTVAASTSGFTPAYLKEALISAALIRAQHGDLELDEKYAEAVVDQIRQLREHLKITKNPQAMAEMSCDQGRLGFSS